MVLQGYYGDQRIEEVTRRRSLTPRRRSRQRREGFRPRRGDARRAREAEQREVQRRHPPPSGTQVPRPIGAPPRQDVNCNDLGRDDDRDAPAPIGARPRPIKRRQHGPRSREDKRQRSEARPPTTSPQRQPPSQEYEVHLPTCDQDETHTTQVIKKG